jgi:hypothetical protein
MDSLERQMERQRQEIQRILDRIEGSGRRRTVLEKLRSSLPSIANRTSVRKAGERETTTEKQERVEPRLASGGPQEATDRPWWRRLFEG